MLHERSNDSGQHIEEQLSSPLSLPPTDAREQLKQGWDALERLVKVRASLLEEDVVVAFSGEVYSYRPEKPAQLLLKLKGYNIARAIETEEGYQLLSREMAVYQDSSTETIIDSWRNPYSGDKVDVVHLWNDPVNMELKALSPRGPFALPEHELGNGITDVNFDVFLLYPSPLDPAKFPEESGSATYQGAELFDYFVPTQELKDPIVSSTAASLSWTRIGPWLPWMKMGAEGGFLVYHARGKKLVGGYEAVDEELRDYVEKRSPEFREAPQQMTRPNATSWSYYKKSKGE